MIKVRFARRHCLPYRHTFHLVSGSSPLTILLPARWKQYKSLFEYGMEVYEILGHIRVTAQEAQVKHGGKLPRLLKLGKIEEQLHQQLYSIHELMEKFSWEDGQRLEVVGNWLNRVQETVVPLTDNLRHMEARYPLEARRYYVINSPTSYPTKTPNICTNSTQATEKPEELTGAISWLW